MSEKKHDAYITHETMTNIFISLSSAKALMGYCDAACWAMGQLLKNTTLSKLDGKTVQGIGYIIESLTAETDSALGEIEQVQEALGGEQHA